MKSYSNCKDNKRCMERSRDYPCRNYQRKENEDGKNTVNKTVVLKTER